MNPRTMRSMRTLHRYLGVFFAPAIIFFAFSGMLQTFSFHEPKGAEAPRWIAVIASLHKHQFVAAPKPAKADDDHDAAPKAAAAKPTGPKRAPRPDALALKTFVGLMSIALILSSLLGIAIALYTRATRNGALVMLAAGTVLPLLLMLA